jgi:hypothetical protein
VAARHAGIGSGTHYGTSTAKGDGPPLRRRGVVFENYDLPGLKTVNGLAEVSGNYPSRGSVR